MRASVLELISSIRLDGKKDIQSVKSAWSVLSEEFKARILLPLQENNKGCKANIHTNTYTHTLEILIFAPHVPICIT